MHVLYISDIVLLMVIYVCIEYSRDTTDYPSNVRSRLVRRAKSDVFERYFFHKMLNVITSLSSNESCSVCFSVFP